jgi:hypothetical protein
MKGSFHRALIAIFARPCPKERGLYRIVNAGAIAYLDIWKFSPFCFMRLPWPTRPMRRSAATQWGWGKFLRRIEDEHWVPADSSQGRQIFDEAFAPNADGERPIYCRPE